MEQRKEKQQQKAIPQPSGKKQKAKAAVINPIEVKPANYCPNCGKINESEALFCEECGSSMKRNDCPRCGSPYEPGADLCERCLHYFNQAQCSFCGVGVEEGDNYCGECGSPVDGIDCPECGTKNKFNFCVQCGLVLTDLGRTELEKAEKEPRVVEMKRIAQELEQLENMQATQEEKQTYKKVETSEQQSERAPQKTADTGLNAPKPVSEKEAAANSVMERVRNLLRQKPVDSTSVENTTATPPEEIVKEDSRAHLAELIAQKKRELQELLNQLDAEPKASPAMARNYAMARKPGSSSIGWKCNFKHHVHPGPNGCAFPQKGGKWIVLDQSKDKLIDDKV